VHRAGIASALGPPLCRLPGLADGVGVAADGSPLRLEARGDILMALPRGITISDISVIHPLSTNIVPCAASTAGTAASHRDQQRCTQEWSPTATVSLRFVPETHGRLGHPAMKPSHNLGEEQASELFRGRPS
jgi:hypothetical protein